MESTNRSGIPCLEHPNQEITNYCLHYQCLKPLCPDCVQVHSNSHQRAEIQSWKHCINKSSRNLKSTLDQLRQIYERQHQYKSYKSVDQVESENVRKLQQLKDKVMRAVQDFFNAQEQKLRSIIRSHYKIDPPNTSKLRTAIEQLEKILMKLGHSATALSALKKSLLLDHQSLVGYFSDLKNQDRKMPVTQNFVSQQYDISRIRLTLEQSIRVLNTQPIRIQTNYYSPQKQNLHQEIPLSAQRNYATNQPPHIQINQPDYFSPSCRNKYLHFFIPVSRQLKLLSLDGASQGGYFKSLQFKSKNQLPCFFKSIITPNGEIYLTGGSEEDRRFREIFRYNYEKNSMDFVCKMINNRSSHSICYLNNCIYLIGGFSQKDGDVSRECEVFRLDTQSCQAIAPLNAPCANSCAVAYNNQYILKIGGILNKVQSNNLIEMYHIKTNRWHIVNIDTRSSPRIQFLSFSAAIQINSQEVLVFGGYDNSQREKPERTCYTVQIDVNRAAAFIKNYNSPTLPFSEGFWNNNPIIHNRKVYALQNITDEQDQLTAIADQRRILVFNGQRWLC